MNFVQRNEFNILLQHDQPKFLPEMRISDIPEEAFCQVAELKDFIEVVESYSKPAYDRQVADAKLSGIYGCYSILESYSGAGLQDKIVRDDAGKEYYITCQYPQIQYVCMNLARDILQQINNDGVLDRLHFPEIILETINGEEVALVEYYRDFSQEPRDESKITEEEQSFLTALNFLFINWDFKEEHILISPDEKRVGNIDFGLSFNDEYTPDIQLAHLFSKSPYLLDIELDERFQDYFDKMLNYVKENKGKITQYMQLANLGVDEVNLITCRLFGMEKQLRKEFKNLQRHAIIYDACGAMGDEIPWEMKTFSEKLSFIVKKCIDKFL